MLASSANAGQILDRDDWTQPANRRIKCGPMLPKYKSVVNRADLNNKPVAQ
jgi:hypothetical protein